MAFIVEPFCQRSFEAGVAAGLCLEGRYEAKRIVGYSYSGVFLPKRPERDSDTHPNEIILLISGTRTYRLLLLSNLTIETLYDEDYIVIPEGSVYRTYDPQVDTDWGETYDVITQTRYKLDSVLWSNTNIYNTDGSLYITASKPIPIYG